MRTFRAEDGKAYTIRLAGRSGRALEAFWAGKATSRDTLSDLRGLPSSAPSTDKSESETRETAMASEHSCDACGGNGYNFGQRPTRTCAICNGKGSLSDRMPVADALADAETLLLEWDRRNLSLFHKTDVPRSPYWNTDEIAEAFVTRCAARAAFRAVPGLRGE